jgi:hypothetical protein
MIPVRPDPDPNLGPGSTTLGKSWLIKEVGPKIEMSLPPQMPTSTDMASGLKTSPRFSTGTQPFVLTRSRQFQSVQISSNPLKSI